MPVISMISNEHDNRKETQGARSLRQVSLDRVADAMLDEPKSYELFTTLPWKLQQDLWTHVLEDRRKRQTIEGELAIKKASMPLMDWEVYADIDKNAEFVEAHPKEVVTDYSVDDDDNGYNLHTIWEKFLKLADVSFPVEEALHNDLEDEETLCVYENPESFLARYSCTEYEQDSSKGLLPLRELISSDLARRRLAILQHASACGNFQQFEDGTVHWDIPGVMYVSVDAYPMVRGEDYIHCEVRKGWEKHKVVEIIINALLSPIEMQRGNVFRRKGRNAFLRRYLGLLEVGGRAPDTG
jgi:hypothetical protein